MTQTIQSLKTPSSGSALLCAGAVAWLLLLSGAVNGATSPVESSQRQSSAQSITAGQPIAREMQGGEEHAYQLTLNSGQYARLVLEQKGIDVVLTLFGPDGNSLVVADNNLSGTSGLEVVSLAAEVSGIYRFNVSTLDKGASPGRYEVRIDDLRVATATDRTLVAAERVYFAAVQLQNERKAESRRKAIEQYGEALPLLRKAGDRRGEAMTLTNIGLIYSNLNEPQKALEYLDQAVTAWHAVGDRHLEALTLSISGGVNFSRGETQKALESSASRFR